MMNLSLQSALDRVQRRIVAQRRQIWLTMALGCFVVYALFVLFAPTQAARIPRLSALIVLVAVGILFQVWEAWRNRDRAAVYRRVADQIERRFPDLDSRLKTAVEEDAGYRPGQVVGYLPSAVIRETLDHQANHDWSQVVPTGRRQGLLLTMFLLFILAVGLTARFPGRESITATTKVLAPTEGRATAADIQVDPGNAEVERGSPLLVVARFRSNVPGNAQLVVETAQPTAPVAMARSLEDPTFAGRIETVNEELAYRVAFDGGTSPTYRVKVFTFPEVKKVDAHLAYPSYTGLESKTLVDVRHVTAIEGTTLNLTVQLNKEVATARLVDEKNQPTPLKFVPGSVTTDKQGETTATYQAGWVLDESHKYKIELVDKDGRKNKTPTSLAVNVTRNRPASVVMTRPGKDTRVSPVEELAIQARTEDDFGVVRHGVNYTSPGGEPVDIVLDPTAPAAKKRVADHMIAFEDLKAQPDQLVSYFFWAEDIDPDGKPRRTSGDLFFAEVRHFEEIFRQGEAPPSGSEAQQQQQNQNAQQAEKLAEVQKQIIAATWKVIRTEDDPEPSPEFAINATAIREAQAGAIEQTKPMVAALRDATSKANLEAAVKAMQLAETSLTAAVNGLDLTSLKPALASEQAAYQALLKLRAREFEVSRQRQQQQQGGGGSASQQQMNELELSNDENRYEEQKSARAQQDAAKTDSQTRETRQVLNRLAELARRQTDLNERLKELQAALEAAQTPAAKAEAERQLKRLRDQEQQILRDTDELRERMEREENRDRMAEARPEADQAREQVRQAAEALEKGQVSQALNQGTRAERELKDLREDLRKKSSERFSDELNGMRDQARQLADKQTKLTDQLTRWDDQTKRSLRDPDARQELGKNLSEQKQELEKLLDQMRGTVAEAEETEPLLAKELFDAVQKSGRKEIPKNLDEAGQLAQAGLPDEAARSSRQASEGLDNLRDGVERAARSILGDESAALKRAQNELEDLASQANRGLARADDPNGRRAATPSSENEPQDATRRGSATNPQTADPTSPGETARQGAANPTGREPNPADSPARQSGQDQGPNARKSAKAGEKPSNGQDQQQGQPQPSDQSSPENQGRVPGVGPEQGQGQQPGAAERPQPGQQPGQQPGKSPSQPGQGQQPGQDQQPGSAPGQGEQQAGQGGQQPRGQSGQQPGAGSGQPNNQQQPAEQGQGQGQGGRAPGRGRPQGNPQAGQQGGGSGGGGNRGGDLNRLMEGFDAGQANLAPGDPNGRSAGGQGEISQPEGPNPISGDGFRQWSDRLRDVEELLNSPDLRAEAARIRDRARGAREEARRHAAPIDPTKLKELVADPILELRNRVAEEVRRRESPDALVPIDRDPVPARFAEGVRRYYERLGSGR